MASRRKKQRKKPVRSMYEDSYKSAGALEMAVKSAARKSGRDINRAMEEFYTGRLFERVFSEEDSPFVLKGGRSMLARTVDARYTRDTDFQYEGADLEVAVEELKRLAAMDLGDFLEFRFLSAELIANKQEYRDGYRVVFDAVLGGTKSLRHISIDLVASQVSSADVDVIKPANRLDIKGIPTFDYRVYPVVCAVADKVCATMQLYSGNRPSSRVRDLVDLVVYATSEDMDGSALSERISLESRLRRIYPLDSFKVPESWHGALSRSFAKSAKEAHLPVSYCAVADAEKLAMTCVNPAINHKVDGMTWNATQLEWI